MALVQADLDAAAAYADGIFAQAGYDAEGNPTGEEEVLADIRDCAMEKRTVLNRLYVWARHDRWVARMASVPTPPLVISDDVKAMASAILGGTATPGTQLYATGKALYRLAEIRST